MSARTTRPVVVAAPAVCEIADAAAAYEATRPGLGTAFLGEIRAVRFRIEEYPKGYPEVHAEDGLRRALVHRFPYGVIYRVTSEAIQILAVLPTRADPMQIAGKAKSSGMA